MNTTHCFWYLPVFSAFLTLAGSSTAPGGEAQAGKKPSETKRYCLTLDLKTTRLSSGSTNTGT